MWFQYTLDDVSYSAGDDLEVGAETSYVYLNM